jgi:hypothetical protein
MRYCRMEAKINMKSLHEKEEIRWRVVKAMLDEFPMLKKKVRSYVEKTEN